MKGKIRLINKDYRIVTKNEKFEEMKSFHIHLNSRTGDESFEGGEDEDNKDRHDDNDNNQIDMMIMIIIR